VAEGRLIRTYKYIKADFHGFFINSHSDQKYPVRLKTHLFFAKRYSTKKKQHPEK
jgi:hypothetical protein